MFLLTPSIMSLFSLVANWAARAIGLLAVALVTSLVFHEAMRPRHMPPTPGNKRPLPFIGNKLDIPKEKSWITFRKWNEQYGPILTIWNGTTPTILIGDPEVEFAFLMY
jgi:Cytochrome P450